MAPSGDIMACVTRIMFWVVNGGMLTAIALAGCAPPKPAESSVNGPPLAAPSATDDPRPSLPAAGPANTPALADLVLHAKAGDLSVKVALDENVKAGTTPSGVQIVAELKDALVVQDTYPSVSGGLSYCQAGEESFLRIFSLDAGVAEETARFKVASCRQNIQLDSPGVEWHSDTSTLRVRWLSGPASLGTATQLTLHVGPD